MIKKQVINKPTSGLAIASFVLGIMSILFLVGFPLGILALFLGIVALKKIKNNNLQGKGLAIAGIVMGSINISFSVIFYDSYMMLSSIK